MKSKTFTLIALLFAAIFLVSSAVAIETSKDVQEEENPNQFGSQKQYRCQHGCCRYSGYRCVKCCYTPEEATLAQNQYKPQPAAKESNQVNEEKYGGWHGGGGGGGGGGWHGGGGGGWHGGGGHGGRGGGRCCGKEKESNQAKP